MLTPLQQRLTALVARLPEARGFALAGGAGLVAHGIVTRRTRDLDYFAHPDHADAVQQLAAAVEVACADSGLTVSRSRDAVTFVRLSVADEADICEIDIAIDYRALDTVHTAHGVTLDPRELGANKVLAIFDRAAARDFLDLAELTKRYRLPDLISLAAHKDPGLDLEVLDQALGQLQRIPAERLGLDDDELRTLRTRVHRWQTTVRQLRDHDLDIAVEESEYGEDTGLGL